MGRDALVVGISNYQYLPGLNAPAQDAEAIAQCLQNNGDFRVSRLPEIIQAGQPRIGTKAPATLAELEAALVRLFKPKGKYIPHTALFYFSGHGLQKDSGIQEGFLATSDANPQAGICGLSLFWLRRLMQESPVQQRIVLLDCCHSGELLNFLEADAGTRSGTDRLFMAASREYEAAYESLNGEYSVFTQALLDGLNPERVSNGVITNYTLTDWVSNALKGEIQQPLFENSGSEIILTRGQNTSIVVKTELFQEICPYRGLEFFDEVHAEYFFGREDLTDHLIDKLRTRNFVAVVGASGSGKSSLVRAGLIHKLRQGQKFSGSDRCRIQMMTPTEQPLKNLATAFVNPKASALERAEQLRRAETFLKEEKTGLSQLVRASLMTAEAPAYNRLVLIIDQFEEVFTLCQGPQAEHDRHRFFNCLINALQDAQDCLSIVVVLRADFFSKCLVYTELAEKIEQHLVTVTPMTYEQIKDSILKPAQKVGLVCEPNLIYNIVLDIVGAPGELPLLQYTLLELWQQRQCKPGEQPRLTLDAYTELGGVRGTLQKRADEIFYSLKPQEQLVAKRVFMALTQLGDGTEDTRRRVLKSELVSPRFPAELVEQVLEKLVAAKLVITNRVASVRHYQAQIDQNWANVSTALRLAQLCRGKSAHTKTPTTFLSRLRSDLNQDRRLGIAGMTQLPTSQLADLKDPPTRSHFYQEAVDVAHEALIRNWSLLKRWLDENRETLRQQRRIEQTAREWFTAHQPRSMEYLLKGERLNEAENYLENYPDELSALAQQFITVSRSENRRTQKELRLLQMSVPCTLIVALVVTFHQYQAVVNSQAEKDYQTHVATSRQRAAVAQSILQDPDSDPTAALLISRLAIEQGSPTYEAQASLRAALQKLRLQSNLIGHKGKVLQVAFSPNRYQLATTGEDGTIRIWSLATYALERVLQGEKDDSQSKNNRPAGITSIAFSPDGRQVAAIAKNSNKVYVWSVESGTLQFKLEGFQQTVTKIAFSPTGNWLATASMDNTLRIWQTNTGLPQTQLTYPAKIESLEFSPDGQLLLIASGSTVQLWQMNQGQAQKVLTHPSNLTSAIFSPSGQFIATGCQDGKTRLWHVQTGQVRQTLAITDGLAGTQSPPKPASQPIPGNLSGMRVWFSPDEQFVATTIKHKLWLWNTRSGKLQMHLDDINHEGDGGEQQAIAFSPDSQYLVSTYSKRGHNKLTYHLRLSNVQTGKTEDTFPIHAEAVQSIQFSLDGSLIATASDDGSVRLWATVAGTELPALKIVNETTEGMAFRPNYLPVAGQTPPSAAIAPSIDPAIAQSNLAISSFKPPGVQSKKAIPIAISTDRNLFSGSANEVITVANDGTIRRWPLPQQIVSPSPDLKTIAQSSTEQTLYSQLLKSFSLLSQLSKSLWFWQSLPIAESIHLPSQLSEGKTQLTPPETMASPEPGDQLDNRSSSTKPPLPATLVGKITPGSILTGIGFSSDTKLIATANQKGELELWQVQPDWTVTPLRRLQQPSGENSAEPVASSVTLNHGILRQLAFSADNHQLLSVGSDQSIQIWDVASGKLLKRLQGHQAKIEDAQFSPDGQLMASASQDNTARIWQVSSGKLLRTLQHQGSVNRVNFSPDSQLVVTASQDGTARIADASTGLLRVVLTGHRGAVLNAAFSPDGHVLVTTGEDGTIRLWNAQTGTEQSLLRINGADEPPEQINQVAFSPDGQIVSALSEHGHLRRWVVSWKSLLGLAQTRSLRQLTSEECLHYLGLPPHACPVLKD